MNLAVCSQVVISISIVYLQLTDGTCDECFHRIFHLSAVPGLPGKLNSAQLSWDVSQGVPPVPQVTLQLFANQALRHVPGNFFKMGTFAPDTADALPAVPGELN